MTSFPYQAEVHSATERFRVFVGGRRLGKSLTGGREAFAQLCIPESRVWIAAPTMDLAEKEFRVVWDLTVVKGLIPVRRKSERELFIQFTNGSFIECRSEERPDQLIGEGLDLVILAEAARMKFRTWEEQIRPTLADRHGRALLSSTPRGFNWFYDLYMQGQDASETDWKSWRFASSNNPMLLRSEIERVEEKIRTDPANSQVLRQEWMAEFVSYGGVVFPEFDYDIHVRQHSYEPHLKTMLWVDPGISNPYCVLLVQVTPDETVRILDEVYVQGKVTDQVIRMAEDRWPYALLDDVKPRQDVDVIIDTAAAEAMASWRIKGYNAWGVKPTVAQGIEVIHRMLRDPFRTVPVTAGNPMGIWPRMTFDPRAKHTIKEFNLYHYPDEARRRSEMNSAEAPIDMDNHGVSCLKYGLRAIYPELFNTSHPSEDVMYVTAEDLGLDTSRMRIESSYAPDEYPSMERQFSLGDY